MQTHYKALYPAATNENPGLISANNSNNQTSFTDLDVAVGTMIRSFDLYQTISHPLAKAIYMLFVISDCKPLVKGNGLVARIFMNAELVNTNQTKILIPRNFEYPYLNAYNQLAQQKNPGAFVRILMKMHEYSASITGENFETSLQQLENTKAFIKQLKKNC